MEIDTKFYITDLRQSPISLETPARPPEISVLSKNGTLNSCSLSEVELVGGNHGEVV